MVPAIVTFSLHNYPDGRIKYALSGLQFITIRLNEAIYFIHYILKRQRILYLGLLAEGYPSFVKGRIIHKFRRKHYFYS